MSDLAIKVSGVSKKFCRSLRQGMLYTTQDVVRDSLGIRSKPDLRPGENWSLQDVSFELRQGECLGLVGANGAGKSTLLKLLNGILRPDKGELLLRGRVGALIEVGAGFHPLLTGRENIYINAAILGMKRREVDRKLESIIEFSGLESSVLDAPVRTYSSGMHVRLGFSVAMHCEVDILLVDEVLAVGDMNFQAKCLNAMGALRRDGKTIVLVSHSLNHIAGWANKGLALERGKVLAWGEPFDVIQRYAQNMAAANSTTKVTSRKAAGSGRARFVSGQFQRPRAEKQDEHEPLGGSIAAGAGFSIAFQVETDEQLGPLEIDIRLISGDNRVLSGGSSRYSKGAFEVPVGRSEIRASYPPIPINGGSIRPSVALWLHGRSELLDWIELEPISVEGMGATEAELLWLPTYSIRELTAAASEAS
jgi:lipopolysaccharide transport system ATP-binding protein